MHTHPGKRIGDANRGVDQNAHQHHHQQKACAAARVETALRTDILHRQGLAVFIAEDGLVLCPVIGEKTLNVLHVRDQRHVDQQDDNLCKAFGEVPNQITLGQRFNGRHNEGRKEDEQKYAQRDAEHHRDINDELFGLFRGEVFTDPFVDLIRFLLLFQGNQARRVHQGLHPLDHRIDKGYAAAHQRPAEEGILLPQQVKLFNLLREALFGPADDCLLLRTPHQDALDQGLSADGGSEAAAC